MAADLRRAPRRPSQVLLSSEHHPPDAETRRRASLSPARPLGVGRGGPWKSSQTRYDIAELHAEHHEIEEGHPLWQVGGSYNGR